ALRERLAKILKNSSAGNEAGNARSLDEKAADIENAIYEPNDMAPEDIHNYPAKIRVKLITLEHAVDSADTGPTPQEHELFQTLSEELKTQLSRWKELSETQVPAFEKTSTAQTKP
ncbi:MAG TPA: hypothetical protein VKB26_14815, partial [Candidatus Acidoferrales bacterium]|nr:hypothetical protein [Candidatus Acidoferrales bacterium]